MCFQCLITSSFFRKAFSLHKCRSRAIVAVQWGARLFVFFMKIGFRVSGGNNRWRFTSVKHARKWFVWFSWLFSRPTNKNSTHIDAYDFPASPQPPQTIQTCYDNREIGFLTWRVGCGGVRSCVFSYRRDSNDFLNLVSKTYSVALSVWGGSDGNDPGIYCLENQQDMWVFVGSHGNITDPAVRKDACTLLSLHAKKT